VILHKLTVSVLPSGLVLVLFVKRYSQGLCRHQLEKISVVFMLGFSAIELSHNDSPRKCSYASERFHSTGLKMRNGRTRRVTAFTQMTDTPYYPECGVVYMRFPQGKQDPQRMRQFRPQRIIYPGRRDLSVGHLRT
jgi:hypothetical protein